MLFFHLTITLACLASTAKAATSVYTFLTFAGNGTNTYGTDSSAIGTSVEGPASVWGDSAGNIYFAEPYHNVVRKVAKGAIGSNTISTFIGVGEKTDSGPDTGAKGAAVHLDRPRGVWGSGNTLFIANTIHRDILSVDLTDANAAVTRVTGQPTAFPGNVDGDANTATWWSPFAGFVDKDGNHVVADLHGCVIRKITSGTTSTLVGVFRNCDNSQDYTNQAADNTVKIGKPYAVAGDSDGNTYFTEFNSGRIQKLGSDNKLNTLISTGKFTNPSGIWVDANKNLFVSDFGAATVSLIPAGTSVALKLADSGNGLVHPKGIWGDALNNIYIPDSGARKVFVLAHTSSATTPTTDPSNTSSGSSNTVTVAGGTGSQDISTDGTPQIAAQVALSSTYYVWSDANSNLFFTSSDDGLVLRVDAITNVMTTIASGFNAPKGLWGDGSGHLIVADSGAFQVFSVVISTGVATAIAGSGSDGSKKATPKLTGAPLSIDFGGPSSVWSDGTHLYVYDFHAIFKQTDATHMSVFAGHFGKSNAGVSGVFTFNTDPTKIYLAGGKAFSGQITGDSSGNVFFSDPKNNLYWQVDNSGVASIIIGNVAALNPNPYPSVNCGSTPNVPLCESFMNSPYGVFVDSSGNIFYTADHKTSGGTTIPDKVLKITSPGASSYSVVFLPSNNPYGLSGDNNGNVYIAYTNGIDTYTSSSRRLLTETADIVTSKKNLRG